MLLDFVVVMTICEWGSKYDVPFIDISKVFIFSLFLFAAESSSKELRFL
jgi:hypothetical protein